MSNTLLTCRFEGRLGNIVLEIYSLFLFARANRIPFDNVKLNLHYSHGIGTLDPNTLERHPIEDYISYCKDVVLTDFLRPHFIEDSEWKKLFKNTKETSFKDSQHALHNGARLIVMKPYQWNRIETPQDLQLFRTVFNISQQTKDQIKTKYAKYFSSSVPAYAVHVRRTDYKLFNKGKYLQSKQSILASMPFIGKSNVAYVVFSDDIAWCKANIVGENVQYHPTGDAAEDLLLMSCFDEIISGQNSTYAYVAKLLDTNIKKIPNWRL